MSQFKLISSAAKQDKMLHEGAKYLVETLQELNVLAESVTHVLANVAQKAAAGQELSAMSANSTAAFMAGVEALTQRMTQDPGPQVANVIRALNTVAILPDGTVSTAAVPIAEHGKKFPDLYKKYKQMLDVYAMSIQRGRPAGEQLARLASALRQRVDQAMRVAAAPKQQQARQQAPIDRRPSLDFTR